MLNFIKKNWYFLTIILCMAIAIGLILYTNRLEEEAKHEMDEIEFIDSVKTYHKMYYEKKFNELKNENKALYDSLKECRNQISYLIQFTSEKEYHTGKVEVSTEKEYHTGKVEISNEPEKTIPDSTYEYLNEPNDTMTYDLKINSKARPNWYSIDFKVKSTYVIVNKDMGDGQNHITISDGGVSNISDVTVYKKEDSPKFIDKISAGPTISLGYDPIRNRVSPVIGVGISYNLFGFSKKNKN